MWRNGQIVGPEKSDFRIVLKENPNAPAVYKATSTSSRHGRPTTVLKEAARPAITLPDAPAPVII